MTLSTALIDTVNAEIRKMTEFLIDNPDGTQYKDEDEELYTRWYEGKLNDGEASLNLRMDIELNEDYPTVEILVQHMSIELLDLLENGDSQGHEKDAFLKGMDGTKKHGKEPVDYKIVSGMVYKEYKKSRKTYEYTVFLRTYIKWD